MKKDFFSQKRGPGLTEAAGKEPLYRVDLVEEGLGEGSKGYDRDEGTGIFSAVA